MQREGDDSFTARLWEKEKKKNRKKLKQSKAK